MGAEAGRADGARTMVDGRLAGGSAAATEARFDRFVAELRAATQDEVAAHRLKDFDFVAVIRVREVDHLEAWCVFDGAPEVREEAAGAAADIEVTIPAELLEDFWSRHLALEILEGRATFTGPVRRLLAMMPVIRAAVLRGQTAEAAA
jgi:hypothetical protein